MGEELTAELIVKVLFSISAGLGTLAGGCWIVLQTIERSGLVTKKLKRDDAVDASSTESALRMLSETRAELERAYKNMREIEEKANTGMQRELLLTRRCTVAEGNVERLRRTLELVNNAQKDLMDAGQLDDPLLALTNIIIDTSGNTR